MKKEKRNWLNVAKARIFLNILPLAETNGNSDLQPVAFNDLDIH